MSDIFQNTRHIFLRPSHAGFKVVFPALSKMNIYQARCGITSGTPKQPQPLYYCPLQWTVLQVQRIEKFIFCYKPVLF